MTLLACNGTICPNIACYLMADCFRGGPALAGRSHAGRSTLTSIGVTYAGSFRTDVLKRRISGLTHSLCR